MSDSTARTAAGQAVAAQLKRDKVVAIFRGLPPERCRDAGLALFEAGLRSFEVTLNTDQALDGIRALRDALPAEAAVGAGTVLTADDVTAARRAGASFVISPDVDEPVVSRTLDEGMASVPGAFTATEVVRAWRAGAHLVKVFPVSPVGAEHIRQLRGPLADIPLLVSGGVDAGLAAECFAAGADAAGVGLPLFGVDPDSASVADITDAGRRFLQKAGAGQGSDR